MAEVKELIRRETVEYESRQKGHSERERHVSRNTDTIPTGKELDADTPPQQHTANGTTNNRGVSPKDLGWKEDHAEEAVSAGKQEAGKQQNDAPTSHEATADEEASKDLNDENGEEIVEAAEDTVIY